MKTEHHLQYYINKINRTFPFCTVTASIYDVISNNSCQIRIVLINGESNFKMSLENFPNVYFSLSENKWMVSNGASREVKDSLPPLERFWTAECWLVLLRIYADMYMIKPMQRMKDDELPDLLHPNPHIRKLSELYYKHGQNA